MHVGLFGVNIRWDELLATPKEQVMDIASAVYRKDVCYQVVRYAGVATVKSVAQSLLKCAAFFHSFRILRYFVIGTACRQPQSLQEALSSMEATDLLREKKLYVIHVIKKVLYDVPVSNLPRICFDDTTQVSQWFARQRVISIATCELSKPKDILDSIVAHELGHYYHRDAYSEIFLSLILDSTSLALSYTGNWVLLSLANTIGSLSMHCFHSFREKEADRFAMTRLDQGAMKTIRTLVHQVIKSGSTVSWPREDVRTMYLFLMASSGQGVIGNHPTIFQRITFAMRQLKTPERHSHFVREFFRFLSVPFYGDLQLVQEAFLSEK